MPQELRGELDELFDVVPAQLFIHAMMLLHRYYNHSTTNRNNTYVNTSYTTTTTTTNNTNNNIDSPIYICITTRSFGSYSDVAVYLLEYITTRSHIAILTFTRVYYY